MASNLSTIGFSLKDEAEFQSAIATCLTKADAAVDCASGEYAIWRSRTGAELWFHVLPEQGDGERDITGVTPFFNGSSELHLKLTERQQREGDTAFEGLLTGWIEAEDGDDSFPLIFEAVDFAALEDLTLPIDVTAKLTGFARSLSVFATSADYTSAKVGTVPLSDKAFFPLGLFGTSGNDATGTEDHPPLSSNALLTGTIASMALLQNEVTGARFYWLTVDSRNALFDIVADPEVVNGEPHDGAFVEVTVSIFGQVIAAA